MKTIAFIYDDGDSKVPLSGELKSCFTLLDMEFEIVEVKKYFYIVCSGVYMWASMFEHETALAAQMFFTDRVMRYNITKEFVLNFIKQRTENTYVTNYLQN